MRLDFGSTITTLTYDRQTLSIRVHGRPDERLAEPEAKFWEASAPGRVYVPYSARAESYVEMESEHDCNCPEHLKAVWYTVFTWQGFVDVADEHREACKVFGQKNQHVVVPIARP